MSQPSTGEQIYALRRKAQELRQQADRLDAQAVTLAATEHAHTTRELAAARKRIAELERAT